MNTGTLFVLALAAFLLLRMVGGQGREMRGHAHAGDRPRSARHEAGHAAVARGLGGRVHSATLNPDGSGLVDATLPEDTPRAAVAFLLGGQLAAGTTRGAGDDEADIARELRRVPRSERRDLRAAAEADARRILAADAARVRRDAQRLMKDGQL